MDSILDSVDAMLQQEKCADILGIVSNFSSTKPTYSTTQIVAKDVKDFYDKEIVKTRKDIMQLCCETMQQSNCGKWFDIRSFRVSASKNVHEIKSRQTKPIEKLVSAMLFPTKIDNAALRYGRKYEKNAAKEYERLYDAIVEKLGVIISEKQPWLCGSLDGIVVKNESVLKVVEFKCPISCRNVPVVDFEKKESNVKYLKFQDTILTLKDSSIYYTQCQVQLYLTGLNICDLFVYSPVKNGSVCVPVHRNENFLQKVIFKCEDFYFKYYLPKLHEKMIVARSLGSQRDIEKQKSSFTGLNIINKL